MNTFQLIRSKPWIGLSVLILFHSVGIIGIILKGNSFIALTPVNLMITAAVLIFYQTDYSPDFIRFCLFAFIAGFAIELMGVETGKIFGEYYYGDNLGIKAKSVPIVIGLNWLILALSTSQISSNYFSNIYLKSLTAAALMVVIDIFIEQLAPSFNFWFWANNTVPLQNYIAWFCFSFFIQLMLWQLKFQVKNTIASSVYVIQLVFFVILYLVNKTGLLLL